MCIRDSIVAVGKGTKENPITVKVGDSVLYGKYAGTELKFDGEDFLPAGTPFDVEIIAIPRPLLILGKPSALEKILLPGFETLSIELITGDP